MKRFLIFSCNDYYEGGGINDLRDSADTLEGAKKIGEHLIDFELCDAVPPYWWVQHENAQILDTETGEDWYARNAQPSKTPEVKPAFSATWEKGTGFPC